MEADSKSPSSNIWRLPPKELFLPDQTVHVHRITLDLPDGDIQEMVHFLSPDEIARANRFVFPIYRTRFIAGRAQLRLILSHYLQQNPAGLIFDYNEFGKPFLSASLNNLQFNISHSHDLGLIAVTQEKLVGVDIERVRHDIDYTQIAQQFFAPSEIQKLFNLPEELQVESFYACWTRKEAFIKARGLGLTIPLDQFEVSLSPNQPPQLIHPGNDLIDQQDWSLYELRPGTGYTAALVVQNQGWEILCWQWPIKNYRSFNPKLP